MEEIENKYLNKIIKVVSNEGRIIIGKLECFDNRGNLYLIQTVEVFDKSSDKYINFKLYENHSDHSFYFDSEKNNYQLYSNVIIPLKEISELKMYKE